MCGGYRIPFDPREGFRKLEEGIEVKETWEELWQELYHQGDVGECSYAAVPHLVRIHRQRGVVDWNPYALVATIELARDSHKNPEIPLWLIDGYQEAIQLLAEIGLNELPFASVQETTTCILALLAIWKGARTHGRIILEFSERELLELEEQAFGIT
jgi:hypothetical protein